MKATYQKSTTAQDVKNSITKTGNTGAYIYTDALTGAIVDPESIVKKEDLLKLKTTNPAQEFEIRNKGEFEYDHMVIEFDKEDEQTARLYLEAIVNELANPDFTWTKDQKDKQVKGQKNTYYDFHKDLKTGEYHAHIYVNNNSFEKKESFTNVYSSSSLSRPGVREAVEKQINTALVEKFGNNANLLGLTSARVDLSKDQVSQATKQNARDFTDDKFDLEDYASKPVVVVSETVISSMLTREESELNRLFQEMENKKQSIARLRLFEDTNNENIKYKKHNEVLIGETEKLTKALTEEKQKLETLFSEKSQEIEQLGIAIDTLKADKVTNQGIIKELRDELQAKNQELDDIMENVSSLENKITEQDNYVRSAQSTIDALRQEKDALTLENKTLTTEKFSWIEEKTRLEAKSNNQAQAIEQLTLSEKQAKDREHMASIKAQEEEMRRREVEDTNKRLQAELSEARRVGQESAQELNKAARELEDKSAKLKEITTAYDTQKQEISDIHSIVDYITEQLTKATTFIKKMSASFTAAPAKKEAQTIVKDYNAIKVAIMDDRNLNLVEKLKKIKELQEQGKKGPRADDSSAGKPPKPKMN